MEMFIFGHGYTAGFLTPVALAQGWRVTGTTRASPERIAAARADPLIWPGHENQLAKAIQRADAILVSVGPDDTGDPVLAALGEMIGQARPKWLGYLSTTGVYGDRDGGWVDESSELTPATTRGKQRAAAEAGWQRLATQHTLSLQIFRLAGIYGPGRGPFAKLRKGTARRIVKPGQVFSRIHVEDIAQVLMASINTPNPGAIYNLCDDEPAPPQDVIAYAAKLLGVSVPPLIALEQAELSPMARSFYAESKRVRNDRIKNELGIKLRYPDYRSGLAAILKAEG